MPRVIEWSAGLCFIVGSSAVRRIEADRECVTDVAIRALQQTNVMGANYTLVESPSPVPIMQLDGVADARQWVNGQE